MQYGRGLIFAVHELFIKKLKGRRGSGCFNKVFGRG